MHTVLTTCGLTQLGCLFISRDDTGTGDGPIGMIVLSPFAKGGGYSNSIPYTHNFTLRTFPEIFDVTPLLGDAANATDLSDLFTQFRRFVVREMNHFIP